jgi:hypothetical protein
MTGLPGGYLNKVVKVMKQPRTSDFDPAALPPTLKSSMADLPVIEQQNEVRLADRPPEPDRPDRPGRDAPPVVFGKRKIGQRHAFDIYEDQFEALKQMALEDRMRGGAGSQSAMVRDAIDDYTAKVRRLRGA